MERTEPTTHTEEAVTEPAELAAILKKSRQDGLTVSVGQHVALAAGVAAPLRASGLTGALSITRARHGTTQQDIEKLTPLVREAAERIPSACEAEHSAARLPASADGAPRDDGQKVIEGPTLLRLAVALEPLPYSARSRRAP
ncbi:IclR family transcriptional regulator domain-containing protein [Streptomyces flaveolus]|uniref:IclR family transcriptional regulator domain-containing protein n=1 Tax=Streptomyces flaveolus TaxID=67297 RepID=UPI00380963A7